MLRLLHGNATPNAQGPQRLVVELEAAGECRQECGTNWHALTSSCELPGRNAQWHEGQCRAPTLMPCTRSWTRGHQPHLAPLWFTSSATVVTLRWCRKNPPPAAFANSASTSYTWSSSNTAGTAESADTHIFIMERGRLFSCCAAPARGGASPQSVCQ